MMQRLAVLLGLCGLPCIVAGGGVWIEEGTLEGNTTGGEGAAASVTLELKPQSSICIHTVQDWVDFSPVFMPMGCGLALMPSMLEGLVLNADGTARLSLGGRDSASGSATVGAPSLRWGWLSDVVSIHLCEGGVQSWCYACGRLHGGEYSVSCSHVPECEARFGAEYDCTCPMMIVRVNWDDDDGDETEDRQAETLAMAENDLDTYRALGSSQSCWCHAEEMSGSRVAGLAASSELRLWSGEELAAESAATFNLEAVRASDDIGSGYFRYDVYDATNGFLRTVIRQVTAANLEFRPDWDDSGVVDFFDRQRLQPYSRPSRWQLRVREMPYLLQLASECPMAMALALGQHCTGGTAPRLVAANGAGVPAKNEVQNVLIDTSAGEGDLALEFALGLSAAATNLIDTLAIHVVDASVKERWTVADAAAGVTYDYSSVDGDVYWNVWRYTDDGREWLAGGSDHVFTLRGLEAGDYQVEVYFDGIYEDGVQGYTATGDFHVLDVRLERLYETANPANYIFNPTPKDDYTSSPVREEVMEDGLLRTYGVPRNNLYVVAKTDTNRLDVTIRLAIAPSNAVGHVYCGAYSENELMAMHLVDAKGECELQIPIDDDEVITNCQIRVGIDLDDNKILTQEEGVPLEVYRYNNVARCANIVGVSKEVVDDSDNYIYTKVGGWQSPAVSLLLPNAKNLLSVFYTGSLSLIPAGDRPTSVTEVQLDAETNFVGYSEWLTHTAGAGFDNSCKASIMEYTWEPESTFAQRISECDPFTPWVDLETVGFTGGPVIHTLTDTGRVIVSNYNSQVRSIAESMLCDQPDWSVVVFSKTNGWNDADLVDEVFGSMSPSYVEGHTVSIGSLGGYDNVQMAVAAAAANTVSTAGNQLCDVDAALAIGRGRIMEPSFWISARKTRHISGEVTYEIYQIGFSCILGDLYDFNFEDGDLSQKAAIVQLGYGNANSCRNHGRIYRHKIKIDKVYTNPKTY